MSVLIKGMEKPIDCVICPFELDGWPDEWELHCKLLGRQVGYFGKKNKVPKGCPIVAVPEKHGALVDIGEVYKVLSEQYHHNTDLQHTALREALAKVPTVLDAEGADHASL